MVVSLLGDKLIDGYVENIQDYCSLPDDNYQFRLQKEMKIKEPVHQDQLGDGTPFSLDDNSMGTSGMIGMHRFGIHELG